MAESFEDVIVGDVVDPITFWFVRVTDVKIVTQLEMKVARYHGMLNGESLKVGKLVAVKNGSSWHRGELTGIFSVFGGKICADVFLVDHGKTLNGVCTAKSVRSLPEELVVQKGLSFKFRIKDLEPLAMSMNTGKLNSRKVFRLAKSDIWSEASMALTQVVLSCCYRTSASLVAPQGQEGENVHRVGSVVFHLADSEVKKYPRFHRYLRKAGIKQPNLMSLDFARCLVKNKMAAYKTTDSAFCSNQVEILPKLTLLTSRNSTVNDEECSATTFADLERNNTSVSTKETLSKSEKMVTEQLQLLKMRQEIDSHIGSLAAEGE